MAFIKNNSYILLIFVICISATLIGTYKLAKEQAYTEVTITEGDTLWGLASLYASDNMTKEQWIREVITMNDLSDTTIIKGDTLRMPVEEVNLPYIEKHQMAGIGQ
ncbi:LysM peptidoglycan-binding domain-containing protein [Sporosarcina sp. 179-K 3D1 HS]|uniref:cell division suppressor protein YneA n=1 Tax=Sporosarcina sp. 179-K 3D1 HS TaxID=3232169 RepID=UPI0039A07B56